MCTVGTLTCLAKGDAGGGVVPDVFAKAGVHGGVEADAKLDEEAGADAEEGHVVEKASMHHLEKAAGANGGPGWVHCVDGDAALGHDVAVGGAPAISKSPLVLLHETLMILSCFLAGAVSCVLTQRQCNSTMQNIGTTVDRRMLLCQYLHRRVDG